jgi:hypothetical protein
MTVSIRSGVDDGALQVNGVDAVVFTTGGITGGLTGNITSKIQPVTASVASNALTVTLNPTILDFRSPTLSSGAINTRSITSAISCTLPATATLGTTYVAVRNLTYRFYIIAIDATSLGGSVELAIVNSAGGNDLTETGLISTTALSTGSDSFNVIYSTTARASVPYRVVGYVEGLLDVTTNGNWSATPSTVQGYGGNALSSMSSLGYGQAWATQTRSASTNYYNTTGKPILAFIYASATSAGVVSTVNLVVAGVALTMGIGAANNGGGSFCILIPNGAVYSYTLTACFINSWVELQ